MEKTVATIYKITNTLNGKIYIGFDTSYPKRIQQHYNDSKRGKESPLCNDIKQYGWENFLKETVYQSWDIEHCLKIMEKYFILENNSYNHGYNRTLGGNGSLKSPRPKSEGWRKKHSKRMTEKNPRKGYKYSENEKNLHSEKMKEFYSKNPDKKLFGEKNAMFGKKHSDDWRKNHSHLMKMNQKGVKSMTVKRPCNVCGFVTTLGNLARYHDNKCKKNVE